MGPAEILQSAWWHLKKSRIRTSLCLSTRASAIGHPCDRYLYYERTASNLKTPHDAPLQAIFDLGSYLEKYVVRELADMGFEVLEAQRDLQDREREITGHIDCKLHVDGYERPMPTEIKGLNPFSAESIHSVADIRDSKTPWLRKYYDQLQVYLHLDGENPHGIFALLNKTSGQIRFYDCPYDRERAILLLAKAERIKTAVATKQPPAPLEDTRDCDRCPFVHVCEPDISFGVQPDVLDDPEIEAALKRREDLMAAAKEYDAIDREIKAKVKDRARVLCGDFVLTGKQVNRKGYTVEPSTYWQTSIRRFVPRKSE